MILNWIYTLHYKKRKGKEILTREHFWTVNKTGQIFQPGVMSGKWLAWATCPGLTEMQLFQGQLFKLQKLDNQGGTSQSLAQQLHWRYIYIYNFFYKECFMMKEETLKT